MPPILEKTPDGLRPYLCHGLPLADGGQKGQWKGDCPFCGKEGKFGVEADTGVAHCWSCQVKGDEPGSKGLNPLSFVRRLWELADQVTTELHIDMIEALATERGVSAEALLLWGVCRSPLDGTVLVPGRSDDGKVCQLYRYIPDPRRPGRKHLIPTPTLGHGVSTAVEHSARRERVYVCEGAWDAMRLWQALRSCRRTEEGLVPTDNPGLSLLNACEVVALPGCGAVGNPLGKWRSFFAGKDLTLCFDSDHPKRDCLRCRKSFSTVEVPGDSCPGCGGDLSGEKPPVGWAAMHRAMEVMLSWEEPPSSFSWLRWGEAGYDPRLPSGFDVRDLLVRGMPKKEGASLNGHARGGGGLLFRLTKKAAANGAGDSLHFRKGLPGDDECSRLAKLLGLVEPVPEGVIEAARNRASLAKDRASGKAVLSCRSWEDLTGAWKRAMRWREDLDRALAVCLAVALSTDQVGDQLFLMLIGSPGTGKCLGKGTPVLMYSGEVKKVEEVAVGDLLMGPDSKPREVLSLGRGREMMYKVIPSKGDTYTVNKSHILSMKRTGSSGLSEVHNWALKKQTVNVSVAKYLELPESVKHGLKGWRTGVDWEKTEVPLDPYYLGLWLGDGDSRDQTITTADTEVRDYLRQLAGSLGIRTSERPNSKREGDQCLRVGLVYKKNIDNPVRSALRGLGVLGNKHIPKTYLVNSKEVRLQVLAGLIDSDGSRTCNCYDYVTMSPRLAEDVMFLCRSLGLAAYGHPEQKSCQTGAVGTYWRVSVSGNCSMIPVKIPRKRCFARGQVKDVLRTGITVERVGEGDYYGFELDRDGLFLLGDFTVTHNTRLCDAMLRSRRCYALEHLTGFHSGFKEDKEGKEDFSLIARVNGKTMITPEGDVMMSNPNFPQIMSQQRRIFDGVSGATYKNRKEDMRYENLRTPWIMAGTEALLCSDQSRLGDRFLKIIIRKPDEDEQDEILRRVGFASFRANQQRKDDTRSILDPVFEEAYSKTGGYVDWLREHSERLLEQVSKATTPVLDWVVDTLRDLAKFVALIRGRPDVGKFKEEKHDAHELPTRLMSQFMRLSQCLTVVLNRPRVDKGMLAIVRRVALDTSGGRTFEIVRQLARVEGLSRESVAGMTGHSSESEGRYLSYLRKIKVVERFTQTKDGEKKHLWRLTPRFRSLWERVMSGEPEDREG